ncbi:hypothetical protein Salat_0888300 [Sesamum alatum]|uniref:Uncharacterized protein n=1 Tax=Sesamum alatum TaxID=300844 RepID=A0AAE1YJK5_9LAMI|nr:hypothetical protein Salat_0888300 [Sesamum alatum]
MQCVAFVPPPSAVHLVACLGLGRPSPAQATASSWLGSHAQVRLNMDPRPGSRSPSLNLFASSRGASEMVPGCAQLMRLCSMPRAGPCVTPMSRAGWRPCTLPRDSPCPASRQPVPCLELGCAYAPCLKLDLP